VFLRLGLRRVLCAVSFPASCTPPDAQAAGMFAVKLEAARLALLSPLLQQAMCLRGEDVILPSGIFALYTIVRKKILRKHN